VWKWHKLVKPRKPERKELSRRIMHITFRKEKKENCATKKQKLTKTYLVIGGGWGFGPEGNHFCRGGDQPRLEEEEET